MCAYLPQCYDNGVVVVRSKYLDNEYFMPPARFVIVVT